jgi:8-oxo-dGTP pyrophosphatase MutT (NUDIX family)
MVIKEPTSSTFVFRRDGAGTWLTALIWHPRLERWLPSGGHVETTENIAEAAIREVREEAGLDVQLLPGPSVPAPAGYPHQVLCAPWWITEMGASPDSHTNSRHVHVDHVFTARARGPRLRGSHEQRPASEHPGPRCAVVQLRGHQGRARHLRGLTAAGARTASPDVKAAQPVPTLPIHWHVLSRSRAFELHLAGYPVVVAEKSRWATAVAVASASMACSRVQAVARRTGSGWVADP